jgi:hypothetical protein
MIRGLGELKISAKDIVSVYLHFPRIISHLFKHQRNEVDWKGVLDEQTLSLVLFLALVRNRSPYSACLERYWNTYTALILLVLYFLHIP